MSSSNRYLIIETETNMSQNVLLTSLTLIIKLYIYNSTLTRKKPHQILLYIVFTGLGAVHFPHINRNPAARIQYLCLNNLGHLFVGDVGFFYAPEHSYNLPVKCRNICIITILRN